MDNPKPRKRLSTPLLLFLILMIVTLLLCAAVLAVWLHGRSVMRSKIVTPPTIGQSGEVLDSHTILHDGKYYRYREGLINLLLLGVDSDTKPAEPLPYGNNNQADVILLAVPAGATVGKRLEAVLEYLTAQDCKVDGAFLWNADETLIRSYYFLPRTAYPEQETAEGIHGGTGR